MTGLAYYNEIEPFAAQWLRSLIAAGLITPGIVDERDIRDVRPCELVGYRRCHFFAGIAVWDYALGLAGWDLDRPVWTGSCPCQPFSAAGRGGGFADERHLWPAFFHLIGECRPATVFGEQVASKDGLQWLDLVHADLEDAGYAVGAADLCAAGVGAPHIRQRLWFVADADGQSRRLSEHPGRSASAEAAGRREAGIVGHAGSAGAGRNAGAALGQEARSGGAGRSDGLRGGDEPVASGDAGLVGDAGAAGLPARQRDELRGTGRREEGRAAQQSGRSFWSDADWLPCRDGKARPVEPGTFPLAHGAPARVGRLRAYGNAINAEAAAAFIRAVLDAAPAGDPGECGRDLRLSTTAETIREATGIFA